MPRYKSLPKAKPKKPDEFVSAVDHAVRFLAQYKKVVLVVVVAGLLGGLGYLIFGQKKEGDLAKLNELIFQSNGTKENQAEKYQQIFKEYGRYPLAQAARLFLVDQYLSEGNSDKALEELTAASEKGPAMLTPLMKFSRAELLWQMGKPDEALKYLDEVAGEAGEMAGYLRLLKGQILESQGKKEEARAVYERIFELDSGDPFLRKRVEAQLVWLNSSS